MSDLQVPLDTRAAEQMKAFRDDDLQPWLKKLKTTCLRKHIEVKRNQIRSIKVVSYRNGLHNASEPGVILLSQGTSRSVLFGWSKSFERVIILSISQWHSDTDSLNTKLGIMRKEREILTSFGRSWQTLHFRIALYSFISSWSRSTAGPASWCDRSRVNLLFSASSSSWTLRFSNLSPRKQMRSEEILMGQEFWNKNGLKE